MIWYESQILNMHVLFLGNILLDWILLSTDYLLFPFYASLLHFGMGVFTLYHCVLKVYNFYFFTVQRITDKRLSRVWKETLDFGTMLKEIRLSSIWSWIKTFWVKRWPWAFGNQGYNVMVWMWSVPQDLCVLRADPYLVLENGGTLVEETYLKNSRW